jgi:hypothetical protein
MMVNHPHRKASVGRISKIRADTPHADWRVCIDGKPTALLIVKGPEPRFREPREYWVTHDGDIDGGLFSATSVAGAMAAIDVILTAAGILTP